MKLANCRKVIRWPLFHLEWRTFPAGEWHSFVGDRKSTRLNSSHSQISYAVFCLKKKKPLIGLPPSYHTSDHYTPTLYFPCLLLSLPILSKPISLHFSSICWSRCSLLTYLYLMHT